MRKILGIVALLAIAPLLPATADRLWLTSGKSLEGRVSQLADGRIEVATEFGSFRFAGEQIVRIERSETFAGEIRARLAALDRRDVEGRLELADACIESQAYSLSRRILEGILEIDPNHAAVRARLGYERFGDRWVTEEEAHELRGEVHFRGRWMSPTEKQSILAEDARQAQEAAQRRQEAVRNALVEARIALMESELWQLRQRQLAHEALADEWGGPILYPGLPNVPPLPKPTGDDAAVADSASDIAPVTGSRTSSGAVRPRSSHGRRQID